MICLPAIDRKKTTQEIWSLEIFPRIKLEPFKSQLDQLLICFPFSTTVICFYSNHYFPFLAFLWVTVFLKLHAFQSRTWSSWYFPFWVFDSVFFSAVAHLPSLYSPVYDQSIIVFLHIYPNMLRIELINVTIKTKSCLPFLMMTIINILTIRSNQLMSWRCAPPKLVNFFSPFGTSKKKKEQKTTTTIYIYYFFFTLFISFPSHNIFLTTTSLTTPRLWPISLPFIMWTFFQASISRN